jgi:hypothetical protein
VLLALSAGEDLRAEPIKQILREHIHATKSVGKLTTDLLRGADEGLEFEGTTFDQWLSGRFRYQLVWLDNDDYSKALVRALWLAQVFAATDFGGARQRDMGQVWTDTARGFLGEIALSKFLSKNFGIETKIDTTRGELEKYLSADVAEVREAGKDWRKPKKKISVKTTKFNGRWLDVGSQFDHSDIFVLVRIGIQRPHFLAFLKAISFFRDKLFVRAKELGEFQAGEAEELWNEIPEFEPLPAYVTGFLDKAEINLPVHSVRAELYGRSDRRILITQGVGLFTEENLRSDPRIQQLDPQRRLRLVLDPILDPISGSHFVAHSGALRSGKESWESLAGRI